ncbi:MAG: hypothetical protein GF329_18230 [Candidatus Lokiarchaeota archaeon]|nr:hypothetical protein [Candidatus Lokiarchaeota archaeon]
MLKLKIEGLKEKTKESDIEIETINSEMGKIDLKDDYLSRIKGLIMEKDAYSTGKDIKQVKTDEVIGEPITFLYGKAESIECGVLFSEKDDSLNIIGVWPSSFADAVKGDPDIFKSLLYRFVKTPEFFEFVKIFNYNKPIKKESRKEKKENIKESEEKPEVPKAPEKEKKEADSEDYIIPDLPYKRKITTKVSIDYEKEGSVTVSEPEIPDEVPESYGESLISEIEDIASSFTQEETKKGKVEVEYWDSCPFCFQRLSDNTIKLLKAGLSTFCPNPKCKKLIKSEYMVKKKEKK